MNLRVPSRFLFDEIVLLVSVDIVVQVFLGRIGQHLHLGRSAFVRHDIRKPTLVEPVVIVFPALLTLQHRFLLAVVAVVVVIVANANVTEVVNVVVGHLVVVVEVEVGVCGFSRRHRGRIRSQEAVELQKEEYVSAAKGDLVLLLLLQPGGVSAASAAAA